jgi:hypothetical protein
LANKVLKPNRQEILEHLSYTHKKDFAPTTEESKKNLKRERGAFKKTIQELVRKHQKKQ